MTRLSNEDMADMHGLNMAYDAANVNARGTVRLYEKCFPNRYFLEHRMFANPRRRLREHGRTGEVSVGPGNYVMQLRRTRYYASVVILMQAP